MNVGDKVKATIYCYTRRGAIGTVVKVGEGQFRVKWDAGHLTWESTKTAVKILTKLDKVLA